MTARVSRKGLTVTTFYLAKGLEFDQVFGVFAENMQMSGLINDRQSILQQQGHCMSCICMNIRDSKICIFSAKNTVGKLIEKTESDTENSH